MKKILFCIVFFLTILFTSCTDHVVSLNTTTTGNTTTETTTTKGTTTAAPTTTKNTTTVAPTTTKNTTTKTPTTSYRPSYSYSSSTTPKPTTTKEDKFENYGLKIIEINVANVTVTYNGIYNTMEEVGVYIHTYEKLPQNYKKKSEFKKSNYTSKNKLSVGGDNFGNYEGLLPKKSGRRYYECDIDYRGGNRNAKRIVYSSDFLIFYTNDHYESFSILKFIGE